jgi:proline-specific peptidase
MKLGCDGTNISRAGGYMREGFLELGEGKIWYSVYGEQLPGTPILAIHGGPGFLTMPQVVSDLAVKRPVYFYDQLGCGRSDRAPDPSRYTLDRYVEELAVVRERLGLTSVYLMGFSWGTALACSYALQRGVAGIAGMVLCGPYLSTARWDKDQRANIARMPETAREAIETGERTGDFGEAYQGAMMAYYSRHVCRLSPWPGYLQEAFSRLNTEVYNSMWGRSEFTISGTLRDLDLVPSLVRLAIPVLLVCGDNDEAGPGTVKEYQTSFPDARMAVIPDASHLHHIEQPEIFKMIIGDFLDSNEGTR